MSISSVGHNPLPASIPAGPAAPTGRVVMGGQAMTMQDLMLLMSINSLKSQDSAFEALFKECEQRTRQLNQISSATQIVGQYRANFDQDGKVVRNKCEAPPPPKSPVEKIESFLDFLLFLGSMLRLTPSSQPVSKPDPEEGKEISWLDVNERTFMDVKDRDALKAAGIEDLLKSGTVPGLEQVARPGKPGWDGFTKGEFDNAMDNLQQAHAQMASVNEHKMMRANQAANKRATVLQFGQSLLDNIKEANQAGSR